MTLEELRTLARQLDIDLEQPSNLIYVFYTTGDGRVNNLSISVKRAKLPDGRKMGDGDLADLMQQYPDAREGRIVAVERPRGDLHRWIDAVELREKLHLSQRTIDRWVERGLLHPSCLGRKRYFDIDEVDRIIRSNIIQENGRIDKTGLESLA